MARSRRELLLSDGITDQKCPQGLLQQNRHITTFPGNVGRLSLSERSRHQPADQIGHIGRE